MLGAAWIGERLTLPRVREHDRAEAVVGVAAVLALYALTAALRHQPMTVSLVLTAAIALGVWAWWDPSPRALAVAVGAAVAGPLAEIAIVHAGAASYAADADDLGGVAPWLPCLYFAAGAVASGLWSAVATPRTYGSRA